MRAECAWCGAIIAEGEPGDTQVSHGICPRCAKYWFPARLRYAVVPSERSFLFPKVRIAFQAIRGIQVILDRRRGDRRHRGDLVRRDRRRPSRERRQVPCLIVGAVPAVAGLSLSAGRLFETEHFASPPGSRVDAVPQQPLSPPTPPSTLA